MLISFYLLCTQENVTFFDNVVMFAMYLSINIGYIQISILAMNGTLTIGSMNIHGGFSTKSELHDFISLVKCYDIFCIQESWLVESQDISIPGFSYYGNDRKKRKKATLRGSGGVIVLFKINICKGLTKIHSSLKETVWIKLNKHTFHMEQDCYLCCTYLPPLNSNHTSNDKIVFTDLEREISRFSAKGYYHSSW